MSEKLNHSLIKRVVIKLGSQLVVDERGILAYERLINIVNQCAELHRNGKQVIIVTSGAVGLGRRVLDEESNLTLSEKQACAAVGQNHLMHAYHRLFQTHTINIAQVLLTAWDFADRTRYLNATKTIETLLAYGVIPIINENDTVVTQELDEDTYTHSFGDNDRLSALVACKIEAQLLLLLTNVDGLYDKNPSQCNDATIIPLIESFEELSTIELTGKSKYGRGGMASKVEAARIASISGVQTIITNGFKPDIIRQFFSDDPPTYTMINPRSTISDKKHWIGFASGYQGVVVVNDGARRALLERNASLLPVGVVEVHGSFSPKQVVSIQDVDGAELGRGLINFSSMELSTIMGAPSHQIQLRRLGNERGEEGLLGDGRSEEVIHRRNMVIF
jgi:glutamate 5-kinase